MDRQRLKVVVTGASSGIGRATALRFSKEGHDVFVTGRSDTKLSETVSLAQGKGSPAIHKGIGDVSVEADVQRNYAEAIKALGGRIDVVVLNAGTSPPVVPLDAHSTEVFDNVFNSNVRGVFLWLKAVLPALKTQGFGQIIIVNSVLGEAVRSPGTSVYSASKFALTGLAQGLRLDYQGTGIKVASVFPAAVDTPIWTGMGVNVDEEFGKDLAMVPDDIADAILNVAYQSPRSDIDKVSINNFAPKAPTKNL